MKENEFCAQELNRLMEMNPFTLLFDLPLFCHVISELFSFHFFRAHSFCELERIIFPLPPPPLCEKRNSPMHNDDNDGDGCHSNFIALYLIFFLIRDKNLSSFSLISFYKLLSSSKLFKLKKFWKSLSPRITRKLKINHFAF